jgi:phosphatidylglycerol:prolipoprotein diacylglycerol transferase
MLPILFESKYFILYAYPLFMGLSWGFGYFYTRSLFEKVGLKEINLIPLFVGLFLSAWIGAKVFFLWFSSGHKIYQYLYANYFWLGGGFVFYGGLIFGLIYYFLYTFLLKKFNNQHSYLLLPGLIFGHAIGRIGCFLTGCCYGSPTSLFLGVKMQDEYRHPVQLYEASVLFIIGMIVLKMIQQKREGKKIVVFYLVTYSMARFLIEFFRGDEIRGVFIMGLSSSQLISFCLIILAGIIFYLPNRKTI